MSTTTLQHRTAQISSACGDGLPDSWCIAKYLIRIIAAAWKTQTRSKERTGAGGLELGEGRPKRKSETQRPLPHGA